VERGMAIAQTFPDGAKTPALTRCAKERCVGNCSSDDSSHIRYERG
jgi:hypothetical protein